MDFWNSHVAHGGGAIFSGRFAGRLRTVRQTTESGNPHYRVFEPQSIIGTQITGFLGVTRTLQGLVCPRCRVERGSLQPWGKRHHRGVATKQPCRNGNRSDELRRNLCLRSELCRHSVLRHVICAKQDVPRGSRPAKFLSRALASPVWCQRWKRGEAITECGGSQSQSTLA